MCPALPPVCQRTSLSYLGVIFVSFLPFLLLLSFFFFFFPLSEEDDEEEEELVEKDEEEEEDEGFFNTLLSPKREGAAVTWASSLFASTKAETSKKISMLLVFPLGV